MIWTEASTSINFRLGILHTLFLVFVSMGWTFVCWFWLVWYVVQKKTPYTRKIYKSYARLAWLGLCVQPTTVCQVPQVRYGPLIVFLFLLYLFKPIWEPRCVEMYRSYGNCGKCNHKIYVRSNHLIHRFYPQTNFDLLKYGHVRPTQLSEGFLLDRFFFVCVCLCGCCCCCSCVAVDIPPTYTDYSLSCVRIRSSNPLKIYYGRFGNTNLYIESTC